MAAPATFDSFAAELLRLVAKFEKEIHEVKAPNYSEARLREDYLNPLISALGWDRENHAGLVQAKREIEIESRTDIAGRAKRADYLFRTDGHDRFICEAKKPSEELGPRSAFQAKRYAWNKKLHLALLTDFEELKVYLVGGKPRMDEPQVGEWKTWHFKQYPLVAQELWDMLSRERVAAGCIEAAIEALPKRAPGKGKARQAWLIKPDRTRELDTDFLEFLDGARRDLASDILKHNDRADVLEGTRLNEATHCILDRVLFIRICEDRDIDTGERLATIVEKWRRNYGHDEPRKHRQESLRLREDDTTSHQSPITNHVPLWRMIVDHFRAMDRRPPSHVPFFNGNLFKKHFSEDLLLGDEWLAGFIGELSDDESPYLFNVIPVEILGSVYERFLGKVVRAHGRGVTIEEKPEVRKAGGVYYTPRYIVDYIVEQTVGRQLDEIAGGENEASFAGRRASAIPGPLVAGLGEPRASGSAGAPPAVPGAPAGNIRDAAGAAADRMGVARGAGMSSARARTTAGGGARAPHSNVKPRVVRFAEFEKSTRALRILDPACGSGSFLIRAFERVCEHWQRRFTLHPRDRDRQLCWVDPATDDVHLTVELKRRILRDNIHGVDLDAQAVEVTQLSLYLKMLEGEDRTTLQRQRELLRDEKETALLPPLGDNIKCGNSLIASDFSMMPEDLVRVNAFDWEVGFREIMKAGGFDAVIGNPPYVLIGPEMFDEQSIEYLRGYEVAQYKADLFHLFIQKGIALAREKGRFGMIVPNTWLTLQFTDRLRRYIAEATAISEVVVFEHLVFADANVFTALLFAEKTKADQNHKVAIRKVTAADSANGIAEVSVNHVPQASWKASEGCIFETRLTGESGKLVQRLIKNFPTLENVARASLGCQAYNSSKHTKQQIENRVFHAESKKGKEYLPELAGNDVGRYEINRERGQWIKYGPWLHDYRTMDWLEGSRILIREISGPKPHSIFGAYVEDTYCHYKTILNVNPSDKTTFSMKYLLGILNSRMISFLYPFVSNKLVAQAFPRLSVGDVKRLPIAAIDAKNRADRARHDKLVMLVDKMLALTPKLRAAKGEAERSTLQNAVTATDRQIDEAVYALYALTPDEIALVEGGQ